MLLVQDSEPQILGLEVGVGFCSDFLEKSETGLTVSNRGGSELRP